MNKLWTLFHNFKAFTTGIPLRPFHPFYFIFVICLSFLCRLTSDTKRFFGGWNLDFVLVSKYKDPEDSSDSDESEGKTESMFVVSTHLNLRKLDHIDLYSVSAVSSDKENKEEEDVIVPEEDFGVESENVEKDPDFKSPYEPYQNTDKKNWTFRFLSFGGSKTTLMKNPQVKDFIIGRVATTLKSPGKLSKKAEKFDQSP